MDDEAADIGLQENIGRERDSRIQKANHEDLKDHKETRVARALAAPERSYYDVRED